jgi:PAS domain S-box-containing protein
MNLPKRFLFIPVVLALSIWLFITSYKDVRNRTINEFKDQQYILAKQASTGIESFFMYFQRELQFLSQLESISNLNEQGKDLLGHFLISHSDQIEAITIVNSEGILKFTLPFNDSVIGQNISNQKHIMEIIRTHKPTVSDVFTSVQGFRTIAYHIPIIEGKEYKGSIAILISLDKLSRKFIENIRTGESGFASMISKEGIELYNPVTNKSGAHISDIYKDYPSVLDVINLSSTDSTGTAECDIAYPDSEKNTTVKSLIRFYRIPLGNTFWTLLLFTPETEILDKLTSFSTRLYLLFSLIVIIITTYFILALKASNVLKEEKKRKALERIVKESENRFRTIFELSPTGIILIESSGKIIEVNKAFCNSLGYSRNEIIGQNIRIFAAPAHDGDIEKNISEILSGKTLINEVTNLRKDGTACFFDLFETKMTLPDGREGILSVSNDITERKIAQQELILSKEKAEESDRLKSAFLANMSHELRTPLNAIIGFASLISETETDGDIASYSKIISDSGMHLLSLVEDILDISMIETGQLNIKMELVKIDSVLIEVKNIIAGDILKENKTEIELILDNDNLNSGFCIYTDKRKLKQVLINLLKNAVKFTDKGFVKFGFTPVEIGGRKLIRFYVKDTGIGIEKKYHKAIFDLFRQIDDSHTRRFGGAGIGLSITRRIVELFGGEIWMESEIGQGSVFFFTVPVKKSESV